MGPDSSFLKAQCRRSYHLYCEAKAGKYGEAGLQAATEYDRELRRTKRVLVALILVGLVLLTLWWAGALG